MILLLYLFSSILILTTKALDPLDEVLLKDMLPSAGNKCISNSQNMVDQTTTHTFNYKSSPSTWAPGSASKEPDLFLAEMSHDNEQNHNRSWTLRVGQGGNIYSFRGGFGEAVPPQLQNEFNDEVFQSVSVNQEKNRDPDGKKYFIHQAGVYRSDAKYTVTPFFSPSIAKHCSGNVCSFASWGQQAHVETFHRSDVLYFNSYRDCGDGIIEFNSVIHNAVENGDDVKFLNVPWGGTRQSVLRDVILSKRSGEIELQYPAKNYLDSDAIMKVEDTGGYTIFAEQVKVPEEIYNTTSFDLPNDIRLILKNSVSSTYSWSHSDQFGAYCMKSGIYPNSFAVTSGCRDCELWFTNSRTNEVLHVQIVIHWAWNNNELFFCPNDITSDEFNERWLKGDEILVSYANVGKSFDDNLAISLVHGKTQELGQRWATSRVFFGKTGNKKRDYNVYTLNTRVQINPGDTYVNQQYMINGQLSQMQSRSEAWTDEVYEDLYPLGEMSGSLIHLYSNDDNTFGAQIGSEISCSQGINRCTGSSVPQSGLKPLFAITCGNMTYVGSDQYYFSPPPTESGILRPYVCNDESLDVRPEWKLLGFFEEGSCDSLQNATYVAEFCSVSNNPSNVPTNTPSFPITEIPTYSPSKNPSETPTKNPTKFPTNNPTVTPTSSPTTKKTTSSPTQIPTISPTQIPIISPTMSPVMIPSLSPTKLPSYSPTEDQNTRPPTKSSSIVPTIPQQCPHEDETYLDIEIQVDKKGNEDKNKYTLFQINSKDDERSSREKIAKSRLQKNELHKWGECQEKNSCYKLIIKDKSEDGICCDDGQGYIKIEFNGETYTNKFEDGKRLVINFGQCTSNRMSDNDDIFYSTDDDYFFMDDDDNHENDNEDSVQNKPTPLKEDSTISCVFLDLFERFKTKILKNV